MKKYFNQLRNVSLALTMVLMFFNFSVAQDKHSNLIDSLLNYHFANLDSVLEEEKQFQNGARDPNELVQGIDTLKFNSTESIDFMEQLTGIMTERRHYYYIIKVLNEEKVLEWKGWCRNNRHKMLWSKRLKRIELIEQSENVSVNQIVTNAKVFYLNNMPWFYTASHILNFLSDSSNVDILAAKGFGEELVFIKIKIRGNLDLLRKKKNSDSLYIENRVISSCDYIIACDIKKKTFYRLKGFGNTDFSKLFPEQYKKKDKQKFLEQFQVDELDLACLFDSFFNKNKEITTNCLTSCYDRDVQLLKIEAH